MPHHHIGQHSPLLLTLIRTHTHKVKNWAAFLPVSDTRLLQSIYMNFYWGAFPMFALQMQKTKKNEQHLPSPLTPKVCRFDVKNWAAFPPVSLCTWTKNGQHFSLHSSLFGCFWFKISLRWYKRHGNCSMSRQSLVTTRVWGFHLPTPKGSIIGLKSRRLWLGFHLSTPKERSLVG